MPLDATAGANPTLARAACRPVAVWLFSLCAMLLVMIVLGGTTRLTGSGLSIMEWAPFTGTLPPLSTAEWQRLFTLYQTIPQAHLLHADMTLAGFQQIFWLEWIHRLWGRLLGIAFIVPLVWFAAGGLIRRKLAWRLGALFLLGGLQGAVGWFMVASGFLAGSTAVSAYRLVVHLGLALFLYAAILWTGLSLWQPAPRRDRAAVAIRPLAIAVVALVGLTILAGGFVAGLHAGLTYNSFPLMDGRLVPAGYATLGFPRAWFENIATVQFDHRLLATLSALATTALLVLTIRRPLPSLRPGLAALGVAVAIQYGLGIETLLHVVPLPLAAAHQACAVLVLTAALVVLHGLRQPLRGPN